jgi:hypothetical protein
MENDVEHKADELVFWRFTFWSWSSYLQFQYLSIVASRIIQASKQGSSATLQRGAS